MHWYFSGLSCKLKIYVSWSTSELRVRLARHETCLSPSVKYFYWRFQNGASFMDHLCYFCLVIVILSCVSVSLCLVVTCWERAGLLALVCDIYFYWPFQNGASFVDHLCYFCLGFVILSCVSVYLCLVVTCWEGAGLLALVCGVYCECVTFPLVSWVRYGAWLYRFLIFALFLSMNRLRRACVSSF